MILVLSNNIFIIILIHLVYIYYNDFPKKEYVMVNNFQFLIVFTKGKKL